MTEDFIPSASIDSHSMPMEVQIPLLEPSSNAKDSSHNNDLKSLPNNNNKTRSSFVDEKIPDPHIVQSSLNGSKALKMSDRLFAVSQLKTLAFYQALLSEFIGTMLLVLIGSSIGLPVASKSVPDLHGALAAGLTIATIIVGFGHTSGAHINPAVTVTFLAACEIDFLRAFCYIGMQLLGASCGSILLKSLVPSHAQGNLGMTMITTGVSVSQAYVVESIITFILCYTVHAICDKRRDDIGGSKALAVGLAVVVGCLFGGPFTGGSMNPARSFGPAAVMNSWENHWVYWFGPLTGSIAAALVYSHIFKHHHQ
ncbi:unnamed protein product [Rotaria sp. Silwood2]|nr:unnamed protein product [Rotaria sp. Silwood2]CAF2560032.1 unnamed protein product [Rotaria sp. Silwood2]CAF2821328.1 unnamed protein product [Rotaria sp. Silwood2]CAF2982535.1 unnamed protein product [Rotaria sp. Silwood2]CAF3915182.1 unnamed protein product [Rotaria sp. Silwood2]